MKEFALIYLTLCLTQSILCSDGGDMLAKMGRPKAENPADKRITIRLNGEEHELLLEYTKNHNMTMTQVVKMAVLEKLMADQK